MRRTAYILALIGLAMIILGIISIAIQKYIDNECNTTTNISWWVANCDYKD